MALHVVTTDDLQVFKNDLLSELRKMLNEKHGQPVRKWLKSHEVRRMLTISPGTLQNLRINGTLPFTKIGGVMYYDYDDIQAMLQGHKRKLVTNSFRMKERGQG